MLIVECYGVKKYFGDRLVIDVPSLKIYAQDRVGIVGANGAGKTTLINILSQRIAPDEGWVKIYGSCSYISQLDAPEIKVLNPEMAAKFGVSLIWQETMSGGEKSRFKIAQALSQNNNLIFADEPTSNLDIEGIAQLEQAFAQYQRGLVIISHDRDLLDRLCNKIIEIENGRINLFAGNYSDYYGQKKLARERAEFEYQQYLNETKRLKEAIIETRQRAKSMRKTPKRMGNSEARLHKMGNQKAKANLERAAKSLETRLEKLEVKAKPPEQENIKFDLREVDPLHSKVVISGQGIHKRYGDRIIFNDAHFQITNNAKVALIGPNGCGKSTLIKMIVERDPAIVIASGAKIGYFSQDMNILAEQDTVLGNVMATSIYPESFVRILLARLLFKRDDVFKPISVLSGGERVKVSLAKILCQDYNLLILDEPTNYLDIPSLEAVQDALVDYNRTLLFVTHDRRLIASVADHIMTIECHKITVFAGSYADFQARTQSPSDEEEENRQKRIMILENRLAEVLGKLSMPSKKDNLEALDKEYQEIIRELKSFR